MTAATFDKPVLLGDVGGTHCRLALYDGHKISDVVVYKTAQWDSLESTIKNYYSTKPAAINAPVLLSFGVKRGQDGWYSLDYTYKYAAWRFKPESLCNDLQVPSFKIVHDFKAMGLSLFAKQNVFKLHRNSVPPEGSKLSLMIGPGSGVGHTLVDKKTRQIYDTHGAHMPASAVSAEQLEIMRLIKPLRGGHRTLIFEDILGGVGLFRLYQACCQLHGWDTKYERVEELLPAGKAGDKSVTYLLKVYSEWLGLYANTMTTGSYAHVGLYLCGGLFERLIGENVFNWDAFFEGFHQNMVAVVDADLRATPIFIASTQHTALYGLTTLADGIMSEDA